MKYVHFVSSGRPVEAEQHMLLSDFLRDGLGMTATDAGCAHHFSAAGLDAAARLREVIPPHA